MLEEVKIIVASFGAEVKARVDEGKLDKLPKLTDDATQEISQLFEPKKRVKLPQVVGRGGEANDEPETDYNHGDKGKTTGNISYGTVPKTESRLLTLCDGCNVNKGWEHKCHSWGVMSKKPIQEIITIRGEPTKAICQCPECNGEKHKVLLAIEAILEQPIGLEQSNDSVWIGVLSPDTVRTRASEIYAKTASIQEEHIAHLIDDVIKLEEKLKERDAKWYDKLLEDYKRIKIDRSRLMDEAKNKDAECQKQLADCIFMQKAKCQARVKRIFEEIENTGLIPSKHNKGKAYLADGTKEYCMPDCSLCEWQALKDKYIKKQEGVK